VNKRHFIGAALCGVSGMALAAGKKNSAPVCAAAAGPVLLTITGAIGPGNRGGLDVALDQMMVKQELQFDSAYTFDFTALMALPQSTISPTLEYDSKQHVLRGPLLGDVLTAAGVVDADGSSDILLRAIDGYVVVVSLADLRLYRYIIATHLDDKPLPLGGLGPLWAVYDADRFGNMMERPLSARFALCPWGIYHIQVKA